MRNSTAINFRRRFLKIASTTMALWGLGAVGAQSPSAKSDRDEAPEQLRIGYQKSAVNLVILKQ